MQTKIRLWIPITLLAISLLFLVTNCAKDDEITSIPIVTTNEVSEITQTAVISGGVVTSDGGSTVTARGICWSSSHITPTIADSKSTDGTGAGSFTSGIIALFANTTYYLRAYATNSIGTGYGSTMSFTTLEENGTIRGILFNPNITYGTMTDIDGNIYKTVTIGTQTWMAENLKTTKYNDGTAIPNTTDITEWSNLETGASSYFNNDNRHEPTYGKLYNWYTVNNKLCPTGWHMPTDAEWTTLIDYLGGDDVAWGKLMETGTINWATYAGSDNLAETGATNETGFTALPGGVRSYNGSFGLIGYSGSWWSTTEKDADYAWCRSIKSRFGDGCRVHGSKKLGLSFRCVKD